jgi:hypothetical protein
VPKISLSLLSSATTSCYIYFAASAPQDLSCGLFDIKDEAGVAVAERIIENATGMGVVEAGSDDDDDDDEEGDPSSLLEKAEGHGEPKDEPMQDAGQFLF